MAKRWVPAHEALRKSAHWIDDLAAQYELGNSSGDPLHSIDKELPHGDEEDTYIIDPHLVITAPAPESNERGVLQPPDPAALAAFRDRVLSEPGPTKLIESHRYIDGSALRRMWREAGCPYPERELRAKLDQIDAEREANYPMYRTRWEVAEMAALLTRHITFRPQTPQRIYTSKFALGNRKRVAARQAKEGKRKAPKRKRGRPATKFPHDRWFEGITLRTAKQGNPMADLLKVAAINTRNPIKAQEAVSDALWLAVRKLRREPKRLKFRSQEKFNAWLRAFVRQTVNRYRDDRWGDITRRRKENVILASGLDVAHAELHPLFGYARGKKKADMEAQDDRACNQWRANGP